ncbi:DUF3549 family protein [Ferrimonas senticii]|uniref:DUF3549 family protein n=1 Tax=Ferrimonas senticii TaxID=394566 RepID=UPI0004855498|nr:DUF3549 family protein [Ferrimonas senticii]
MADITTLDQFLSLAGTQYRVFDLGRRVTPLASEQFAQFEQGRLPYPFPRAGHAWIGILFWDPTIAMQHYVWFLKLPLDEQGLINPAARNQFLQLVIEALGNDVTGDISEQQQQRLASNPFIFAPTDEKMAVFNARVRLALAQPASVHFEAVQEYIAGQRGWDNWQHLGLQGLADYCCRLTSSDAAQLAMALPQLPAEAFNALISVAEHFELPESVAQVLRRRAAVAEDEAQMLMALRGLAGNPSQLTPALTELLQQPLSADALITISARLWLGLDHSNVNAFLQQLAEHPGNLFNQLYLDLVAQPNTRPWVLAALRDPNRSEQLTAAISQLMNAIRG